MNIHRSLLAVAGVAGLFVLASCQPPAARPAGSPASRPATQPATAAASKPASQAASQSAAPTSGDFAPPPGGWKTDVPVGNKLGVNVGDMMNPDAWFHLAVPPSYTPDKAWPLVVVLHGGPGGSPDEIVSFFRGGLIGMGAISVYPHALDRRQLLEWNYPQEGAYMLAIIRQVARQYRIDPRRIYLTGVSMGGGGTWANGAVMNSVWAGIAPIAGWYAPTPKPDPGLLKDMPIYCLHGDADAAVTVERSRAAKADMEKLGRKVYEIQGPEGLKDAAAATMVYREVKGGQHNVLLPWDPQGKRELGMLFTWLLQQRRAADADLGAAEKSLAQWGKQFGWKPGGLIGSDDRPQ